MIPPLPPLLIYRNSEDRESQLEGKNGKPKRKRALAPRSFSDPALERHLLDLMGRFQTDRLANVSPEDFERHIKDQIGRVDYEMEGYTFDELDRQRDLSIKFHWGHNHDFGSFALEGRMGDRHLDLLKNFLKAFDLEEDIFRDRNVLDIGCWTGGTTLTLNALGARVTAVEEVNKYAEMTRYLTESFGIRSSILNSSVYDLDYREAFDLIYFPGVIYHLSDPLIALRILYNAVRIGGQILVESAGRNLAGPICLYQGSTVFSDKGHLSRGGWNWFVPSPLALARMLWAAGFDEIRVAWVDHRLYAHAVKVSQVPITRAGLSRRDIA